MPSENGASGRGLLCAMGRTVSKDFDYWNYETHIIFK